LERRGENTKQKISAAKTQNQNNERHKHTHSTNNNKCTKGEEKDQKQVMAAVAQQYYEEAAQGEQMGEDEGVSI
jgi:hypothetical protein